MSESMTQLLARLAEVTAERDRLAAELAKLRAAPAVPVSVLTIFERLRDDLLAAHADAHDSMHRALLQSADHSEKSLEMVTPEFRNSAKDSGV